MVNLVMQTLNRKLGFKYFSGEAKWEIFSFSDKSIKFCESSSFILFILFLFSLNLLVAGVDRLGTPP